MLKDLFRKPKYVTIPASGVKKQTGQISQEPSVSRKELPDGLWVKCPKCGEVLFNKDLDVNAKVCLSCRHHFRLTARERLALIIDTESFEEWDYEIKTVNPLDFPNYQEKLEEARDKSQNQEAVITGRGLIEGEPVVVIINDGSFMMGSMGSVVGEKITRAIERAVQLRLPVIVFSTSGGARMQEGILSLYQMAKTSAALGKLAEEGLLYISVLTDPTFGGVTASYASLGDINIAEPGALIGFTGPRVIKQTMRKELPEGAQTAEFNQEHGLIDLVIDRLELKQVLAKLLRYHGEGVNHGPAV